MSAAAAVGQRFAATLSRRSFKAAKRLYQYACAMGSREPKRILFILGCQRSGTTLLLDIFERDMNARTYREFSEITWTAERRNLRLKPLEEVGRIFARAPTRFIVAKPIAETQNALRLLEFFPEAKVIFVFRHYAAVASSNLKQFGRGNGLKNLRPIIAGEEDNWRAQGVPEDVRALVRGRFAEDMDPHDAAALFWFVRNRFFFDLGLDRHPQVMPLRYDDLVREPAAMLERVYRFVGMPRCRAAQALVHSQSLEKGKDVALSPDVRALCEGLLERLDRAYEQAWKAAPSAVPKPWLAMPSAS